MEVADGGGIGVDCSVGTIVWVRRRNGSWWPGRILGSEELSASHLMSPRSGTPVKLLGREDASVDWYNLKKSKRIKAFWCGEFDDCIERAEASKSIPIKKREKYARREDAILHALELEKQQLELKQQILGITSSGISSKSSGAYEREPIFLSSPEICMRHDESVTHGELSSQKSENFLKTVGFSLEEEGIVTKGRGNQQFIWEDNHEATPRLRGLRDFGLQMAQSKIKPSLSVTWENSGKSVDNHVESLSCSGYMVEGAGQAGSGKNTMSDKRKRSCSGSIGEELVKKCDRRRPLVQVLQSSAKLPPRSFQPGYGLTGISSKEETDQIGSSCRAERSRCVYLPVDLDDHPGHGGHISEHMPVSTYQFGMDNDIDHPGNVGEEYTSSILIEVNASHYSEDDLLEHDMVEETNMIMGLKEFEPPEFQVSGKFRNLIMDESSVSGFRPKSHGQTEDASSDLGASRWHMKGKRNNRNIGKRLMDASDVKICNTALQKCSAHINAATYENKGSRLKFGRAEVYSQSVPGRGVYPIKEELQYAYDDGNLIDKDLDQNQLISLPLQSTKDCDRSHSSLNDSNKDFHGRNSSVLEPSDLACNSFWEEPVECFDQVYDSHPGTKMEALLVDVDLKVQASYQGEHVPLVSLMSRLNGKAILGHPVQVDILEDGSVSHLVSTCDAGMGESTALPAVWRTARRTAMQRVPSSVHSTSRLEEAADLFQYSDSESKPFLDKKSYSDYINHQMRPDKKRGFLFYQSGLGKFQKKSAKRVSLSSQKIRSLSSLSSDAKVDGGNSLKLARSNDVLGGLIKPDGSDPLVACVPVKAVFSRILQAVGRPLAASHPVRMEQHSATQGL